MINSVITKCIFQQTSHIYIYICVCVCVCKPFLKSNPHNQSLHKSKKKSIHTSIKNVSRKLHAVVCAGIRKVYRNLCMVVCTSTRKV